LTSFLIHCSHTPRHLHSFPTRRSSDLKGIQNFAHSQPAAASYTFQVTGYFGRWYLCAMERPSSFSCERAQRVAARSFRLRSQYIDRKSTRLNSSHVAISYAVFCLKKKK